MSSTAVLTMTTPPLPRTTTTTSTTSTPMTPPSSSSTTTACCPACGIGLPPIDQTQAELLVARARIHELESQVRQLNHKASVAVERWAAYEAELSRLRATTTTTTTTTTPSSSSASPSSMLKLDPAATPSPTRTSFLQSAPSRLSSLLYPRKSTPSLRVDTPSVAPAPASATTTVSSSATEDLLEALTREQMLRREAEGRLSATSKEVEELSASLFEQANGMVADERRVRARLEERVDVLEKRDLEKRRRLERLEVAMRRIEKARDLLTDK
ncbi:hypothetical protein L249_6298 [Ophiocordyceps polyrhachis-furcata BCC 54312]|uniref:GDP/GTP exchange factor Sec2 N-terminal domain-containing protein n=1 Tax=Ophiocordyceps polyrhachis-furcata BCC 54312 TaxID=1330021 RepID=A0A367L143_9HYPO|nr:hypothetical protein L249_6298 [Ophiocordyceps polyrhachis-furcata BCC 54312]